MRWVVSVLTGFALAVGLAIFLRFNHGNLVVLWPPYRIDVALNLALAVLLGLILLIHGVLLAVWRTLNLPQRVRDYQERRHLEQASRALREAVLAYLEGRFSRVDSAAQRAVLHPMCAAPAALLAARAAQRLQEDQRRDRWLARAEQDDGACSALWMTQAELAVEDLRADEALAWLDKVHGRGARHMMSLRLALRAFEQAQHWDDVLRTLRAVEKRRALHPAAVYRLRVKAGVECVARMRGDAVGLRAWWRALRPEERALPALAAPVAGALMEADATEDARRIIEDGLDRGYDLGLVELYARLKEPALRARLERLESWRQRYGDQPALLWALGRVCMAEKLWGKAEDYLRAALAVQASAAAHIALGELYEALQRPFEAAAQFRLAVTQDGMVAASFKD